MSEDFPCPCEKCEKIREFKKRLDIDGLYPDKAVTRAELAHYFDCLLEVLSD